LALIERGFETAGRVAAVAVMSRSIHELDASLPPLPKGERLEGLATSCITRADERRPSSTTVYEWQPLPKRVIFTQLA